MALRSGNMGHQPSLDKVGGAWREKVVLRLYAGLFIKLGRGVTPDFLLKPRGRSKLFAFSPRSHCSLFKFATTH
jgi:hypothetical protein